MPNAVDPVNSEEYESTQVPSGLSRRPLRDWTAAPPAAAGGTVMSDPVLGPPGAAAAEPAHVGFSGRENRPHDLADLVMYGALELSRLITRREVSCIEVMNTYLDHIELHNRSVNAIVALRDRDELVAEARVRDRQLASGQYLGWMHGFPHAVKDLAAAKGLPFTSGSPIFADRIADSDDLFVKRIKAAGAIIIGKTNTPEFGLGSQTYNPVWGTTATPYDTSRTSGGSSGGAAAALAPVSYTHLRAHETRHDLVCRLLLEKKKKK